MKRAGTLIAGVIAISVVGGMASFADEDDHIDAAGLAKALPAATISLEQGFKASAAKGKPISGKFEVADGGLQLSVYTMNGSQFFEVIIDHKTGAVAKTEKITDGGDLKAAQNQSKAMAKATSTLEKAIADAVAANANYRAVRAEAEMKMNHPVAEITLMNGKAIKQISEKLD